MLGKTLIDSVFDVEIFVGFDFGICSFKYFFKRRFFQKDDSVFVLVPDGKELI